VPKVARTCSSHGTIPLPAVPRMLEDNFSLGETRRVRQGRDDSAARGDHDGDGVAELGDGAAEGQRDSARGVNGEHEAGERGRGGEDGLEAAFTAGLWCGVWGLVDGVGRDGIGHGKILVSDDCRSLAALGMTIRRLGREGRHRASGQSDRRRRS